MIYFLGWICFLLLSFISGVHFYWTVGGKWGLKATLPTKENGTRVLEPKWIDCLSVAIVLGAIALLYAIKLNLLEFNIVPSWFVNYGLYIVSTIFFARAIGDFKYVGFFKKVKTTVFAVNDSKYFSPLCVFFAVTGILIEVF